MYRNLNLQSVVLVFPFVILAKTELCALISISTIETKAQHFPLNNFNSINIPKSVSSSWYVPVVSLLVRCLLPGPCWTDDEDANTGTLEDAMTAFWETRNTVASRFLWLCEVISFSLKIFCPRYEANWLLGSSDFLKQLSHGVISY